MGAIVPCNGDCWRAAPMRYARLAHSHNAAALRGERSLCRDDARVDARPVQAAEDARVLDLHATVVHDIEAAGNCRALGFVIADAELHPQDLGLHSDGLVRE